MPNALINASSPYLLQHAYNPVEWNEWDENLLAKAKDEKKLIVISIGYAACHWCHVMEHESFEDDEVASWMNQFYINIKVDREERPDIDAVYMNAAHLTTGRGGWPLNVIALPDGRPVFAGTYFPKTNWIKILEHFVNVWKTKPEEMIEVASKIEQGLHAMEMDHLVDQDSMKSEIDFKFIQQIVENIYGQLDLRKGGLDKAPKFPMPCVFDFLGSFYCVSKNETVLSALEITLTEMMNGGIYDQVGGGFARYSTDENWFAPHFEKMLYDNGQLLSLYSKGYAMTGNSSYKRIVDETIVWLNREMLSPEGLFYSSLDADSEGVEGKFYCWSYEEIEILVPQPEQFIDYFGIKPNGNWEGMNILSVTKGSDGINYSIIEEGKKILLKERENRIRPGLDDKCLTSWNALTIIGLCHAHQFTGHVESLQMAEKSIAFILKNLRQSNQLFYRNFKNHKASIPGFLDDQALMVKALIELYRTTWNENYLQDAKQLLELIISEYWDEKTRSFYYTGKGQHQPVLKNREMSDNVIPSSNAIMADVLWQLGLYFDKSAWKQMSHQLCQHVRNKVNKYGPYYSYWANVLLAHTQGYEIAITGQIDGDKLQKAYLIPGAVLMLKRDHATTIPLLKDKPVTSSPAYYICKDKTCGLPLSRMDEVMAQLADNWRKNM